MKAQISIKGMHCNSCVMLLTDILTEMEGVKEAEVSLEKEQAVVEYDPKTVNVEHMKAAIEAEGYTTE